MKVDYTVDGTGEAVVFIHGLSDDLTYWQLLTEYLKKNFQIIRFNLRGHGGSDLGEDEITMDTYINDLNNILIELNIEKVNLIGFSIGGAIAMGFDNAFWAIMDSNITTFIAAIFLSQLGTGAIQGFAVSLAIGVVSSVFTALFVSRLIFDFDTDVLHAKKVSIGWGIKQ